MRSIDTDIIEQILLLNNMLLKISEKTLFRDISLTPQQFNVLGEIILAKKMSVNVLKDKLILSSPALSQMLKRMENAGYIKRVLGVKDKREVEILPTKLGKELYDQINQKYFDLATQTLTEISGEKKEECFTTLCELQKILEKTRFE